MPQTQKAKLVAMRVPSRRRGRVRLRWLIVCAFLVWGAYEYWFVQRPLLEGDALARMRTASELSAQIQLARSLQDQIQALRTYSYIASIAEDRYHLIKPGEILFTGSARPAH